MTIRTGGGWKRKPTRLFSGPCPVTGGRPTTMLRRTFNLMCIRHQEDFDSSCRFICKGRWPQAGLELIDDVKNFASEEDTMAVPSAIQAGICGLCGAKKKVRKVREKTCCATCEHIWRAAHVSSGLLVDALNQARGEGYLAEKVGGGDQVEVKRRLYAMEQTYENMRLALGCQGEEEALESVIRLVKERDAALDDLQQIRSAVGLEVGSPLVEYIEGLVGVKDDVTRRYLAVNDVIENVREMLGLDAEEAIIEEVHQLLRNGKKATDIWFETAEIMGIDCVNADQIPIRARELMQELSDLSNLKAGTMVYLEGKEGCTESRDTALLDLAIDVLAGRITGIDAARISALR